MFVLNMSDANTRRKIEKIRGEIAKIVDCGVIVRFKTFNNKQLPFLCYSDGTSINNDLWCSWMYGKVVEDPSANLPPTISIDFYSVYDMAACVPESNRSVAMCCDDIPVLNYEE